MKTVVSVTLTRSSDNLCNLILEDSHSGDKIIQAEFSLEELALLITGLSGVKGVAEFNQDCNIACKRETKTVSIEVDSYLDKRILESMIENDFHSKYAKEGYVLQGNGLNSQQNTRGVHRYVIKKYVPVENPLEVERFY